MLKSPKISSDERGFASVVVALTMIIVLALLTIGFAQLARREQQNTLDKQLAIQAYYAAESGINDVVKNIDRIADSPNTCVKSFTDLSPLPSQINTSTDVSYSCVLVNKQPKSQQWSNVSPESGHYTVFDTSAPINDMTVQWGSSDGQNSNFAGSTRSLPTKGVWNGTNKYPAVVQFSVTPLDAVDRNSLINNTFTVYLYPSSSATSPSPLLATSANKGQIVWGGCTSAGTGNYPCKVTISGLTSSHYLVAFQTYYDNGTNILLTGTNSGTGSVKFLNGQILVDVTGKAHNVLKRLQVTIPPKNVDLPTTSIQAGNLCKRIQTEPNSTSFVDINGNTLPGASTDPCRVDN